MSNTLFINEEIKQAVLDDLDAMWWAYQFEGMRHDTAQEFIAKWDGTYFHKDLL